MTRPFLEVLLQFVGTTDYPVCSRAFGRRRSKAPDVVLQYRFPTRLPRPTPRTPLFSRTSRPTQVPEWSQEYPPLFPTLSSLLRNLDPNFYLLPGVDSSATGDLRPFLPFASGLSDVSLVGTPGELQSGPSGTVWGPGVLKTPT